MEDFEKIESAYKLLNSVNDEATRMWRIAWGIGHRQTMSLFDIQKTHQFIKEFGYDNVRFAFEESAMQNIFTLAYVRKILENKKQKDSLEKHRNEAKEFTKVVAEISGDKVREKTDLQPKKWVGFAKQTLENK
jgi:hypothetical protein